MPLKSVGKSSPFSDPNSNLIAVYHHPHHFTTVPMMLSYTRLSSRPPPPPPATLNSSHLISSLSACARSSVLYISRICRVFVVVDCCLPDSPSRLPSALLKFRWDSVVIRVPTIFSFTKSIFSEKTEISQQTTLSSSLLSACSSFHLARTSAQPYSVVACRRRRVGGAWAGCTPAPETRPDRTNRVRCK